MTTPAQPIHGSFRTSALHHDGVQSVNMKKHPKREGAPQHSNGVHLPQKVDPSTVRQVRSPNTLNGARKAAALIAHQQQQAQYPPGTGQKTNGINPIPQNRPSPPTVSPPITQQPVNPLKRSHHDLLRQHNEEMKQQKVKQEALKEAQASFGRYVAVDSKHFNCILPVLPPRAEDPKT